MTIRPITGHPAAFISEEKILAISDIQIGLEHELYKKGIVIHAQVDRFLKDLTKLIKKTKSKKLLIVGDLKHKVPGISLREERELIRFFKEITKIVDVILVRGNHDTGLKGLLPDSVKVYESPGVKIGNYGFFHGHAWPAKEIMECDNLIMGHLQPGVEFSDKIGYSTVERVWLRGDLDKKKIMERYKIEKTGKLELTILPAFNKLLGSAPVNKMEKEDFMGPFSNGALDMKKSKVYLLDGTFIGTIGKMNK